MFHDALFFYNNKRKLSLDLTKDNKRACPVMDGSQKEHLVIRAIAIRGRGDGSVRGDPTI